MESLTPLPPTPHPGNLSHPHSPFLVYICTFSNINSERKVKDGQGEKNLDVAGAGVQVAGGGGRQIRRERDRSEKRTVARETHKSERCWAEKETVVSGEKETSVRSILG